MEVPKKFKKPSDAERDAYKDLFDAIANAVADVTTRTDAGPNIILSALMQYTIQLLEAANMDTATYASYLDSLRVHHASKDVNTPSTGDLN